MNVKEAWEICTSLRERVGPDRLLLSASAAWHCGQNRANVRLPQKHEAGVYLLSKPAEPNWNVPIKENEQEVWYIGSSHSGLGRVWKHLGRVYNPNTGAPFDQPFADHRWQKATTVATEIRDSIAAGGVSSTYNRD